MIHSRSSNHRCWLVLVSIALSVGAWSQEWSAEQERDLRLNALQRMTFGRTSYRSLSALREEDRTAFKNLFSSDNAIHVLDIPGTRGLLFDNGISIKDYLEIVDQLLPQNDFYIRTEILWISPSQEISPTQRNTAVIFSKNIKWRPKDSDRPLEWLVILEAKMQAEVSIEGEVNELKIESIQLKSGAQAYVRVLRKLKFKPIPFGSQVSQFPLIIDGNPLGKNDTIVLVPESGVPLGIGDASDLILLGDDRLLTLKRVQQSLKKVQQSKYLKEPNILDITQTISGIKYNGRFTAGITAAQVIGHGKYQSAPVNSISSRWSPGFRLSFRAPMNGKLDWTTVLGLQTSTSSVNFNATQLTQNTIDTDAMEYERLTDVTFGQESLASNTYFAGIGSTYNLSDLFIRATINGTLTSSRFEANADIRQRGHYPSLYGITIDDAGIYDFGAYSTSSAGAYDNALGWMAEAAIGYQFPLGSVDWKSARPMCYLSAGIRYHSEERAGHSPWVEGTQSLQGALNAFGSNSFQTYFIEIALDLRRRIPPFTN